MLQLGAALIALNTELLTVLSTGAAVAGILSFVLAAASYSNDPDKSLTRVAGWVIAVLGFLTTCSLLGWLVSQGLSATHRTAIVSVAAAAFCVACVSVAVAIHAPASDLPKLRAIAAAAEEYINRLRSADIDQGRYVPMSMYPRGGVWVRRTRFTRLSRWPTAPLTLLAGGPGSGKSVCLRQMALGLCGDVKRRRRPRQMVVYIDLHTLNAAPDTLTLDVVREHLKASVRASDEAAAEFLDQYLERPRSVRWVFLFDSLDALALTSSLPAPGDSSRNPQESTMEEYVRCIARLVENRRDFRAIIAVRQVPKTRSFTGPVQTMADLSPRQQRTVLRPFGITSTTHRDVFDRLSFDPVVKDIAANPLLLSMLGQYLQTTKATELRRTRYEILDGIIDTQIESATNPTSATEVRLNVERISYRMFAECVDGVATSATQTMVDSATDTTTVTTAGDAAVEKSDVPRLWRRHWSGFQFCHRAIQVHFAATYLLNQESSPTAYELITSERWDNVVITALQAGSATFRSLITQAAADLLVAEVALLRELVPNVRTYLQEEQPQINPGGFEWPPLARHVLRILREGLRFESVLSPEPLPAAAVDAADRLILTAVVAGGFKAKEDALDLLPVASPEVAIWITERAVNSDDKKLVARLIHQVAVLPGVFRELKGRYSRCRCGCCP